MAKHKKQRKLKQRTKVLDPKTIDTIDSYIRDALWCGPSSDGYGEGITHIIDTKSFVSIFFPEPNYYSIMTLTIPPVVSRLVPEKWFGTGELRNVYTNLIGSEPAT